MMKRPHCGNDNYDYVSRHASQRSGRWTWKYIHPLKSPIPPPPELNTCILCYLCSHNSSHKARWYFSWGDPGTGSPRHTSGTSRAWLGHWSHTLTLLGARQDLKWFIALSLFFLKKTFKKLSNVTLPLSIQTAPMFVVTRPKATYQKELFVKLSLIIIFWFRFWHTSKSPLLCGKTLGNSASEKSNTQHSVIDPFHWTSPKKKLTLSPTATNIKAWT